MLCLLKKKRINIQWIKQSILIYNIKVIILCTIYNQRHYKISNMEILFTQM